eukprot:scaffold129443_cov33-Tisochrysis_lutea.AAC.4
MRLACLSSAARPQTRDPVDLSTSDGDPIHLLASGGDVGRLASGIALSRRVNRNNTTPQAWRVSSTTLW